MSRRKRRAEIVTDQALLNVITPMGMEFSKNGLVVGEQEGRVLGLIKYPQSVPVGWLARLTNLPGSIASLTYTPTDPGKLMQAVNRNISISRGIAAGAKNALEELRAARSADNGERILEEMEGKGQSVGILTTCLLPLGDDERNFKLAVRRAETAAGVLRGKVRNLATIQKQGFKQISPTFPSQKGIEEICGCMVPLSTFIGGLPFSTSGYNDGSGYYMGQTPDGNLIIVDTWKRGNDRTNSNMVLMGDSGSGKSTTMRHIIFSEYMIGVKILIIDPEREYRDTCRNLGGDWINTGGGRGGRINPLQVRPVPRDEDDESEKLWRDEGNGMGDLALYMQNLDIFFGLYIPSLSDMHKAHLRRTLVELYAEHGITWETDVTRLKNEDFPILSDLHALIERKAKAKKADSPVYEELSVLLYDIAHGADSFLWNGHTTIESASQCVCLDTHELQGASDNVKRAQYFNVLNWCWSEMSQDRSQPVMLVCDEAWLMIDPHVPQSLIFLRNVEKRARKYESAVAVISHSVVDFLDPQIKMYGEAVLQQTNIKILMGTDGENLKELKTLYALTDAQAELLESKRRKHALMIIGASRMHIVFELPDWKLEMMGKGGGN